MDTEPELMGREPHKTALSSLQGNPRLPGTQRTHALLSRGRVRSHVPNHRSRYSLHLTEAQALGLIGAAAHAHSIGRPLNRFVSIHLERGGLDPRTHRAQEAVGRYLRLAGQWLADRGIPSTFLWVLEHSIGTGLHVHMLIHVPPGLAKDFSYRARSRWLSLSGIDPREGVIRTERVGPRGFDLAGASIGSRQSYLRQLQGVLRYMLKAIDPKAKSGLIPHLPHAVRPSTAELLKVEPEYCAPIYGRRCSRSQNIGETAQKRYALERLGPIPAVAPFGKAVLA